MLCYQKKYFETILFVFCLLFIFPLEVGAIVDGSFDGQDIASADLKNLIIEGYELDFDQSIREYTVVIPNGVNVITVIPEVEDIRSSVKVVGADNLKMSDYRVVVEVTSFNGKKKDYMIMFTVGDDSLSFSNSVNEQEIPKNIFGSHQKIFQYGCILGIILLGIGIVGVIIHVVRNRKLDKLLDEML